MLAKAFCDEETAESKAKQADLTGKLDKTTARIDQATATTAQLQQAIKKLESEVRPFLERSWLRRVQGSWCKELGDTPRDDTRWCIAVYCGEVADMDAAEAEATKVRQGEHADYLKASSDFKASAEAVAKAMEVLNNYYSSASFLQVQVTTGQAPELGGAKGDVGSTIVSVLEARGRGGVEFLCSGSMSCVLCCDAGVAFGSWHGSVRTFESASGVLVMRCAAARVLFCDCCVNHFTLCVWGAQRLRRATSRRCQERGPPRVCRRLDKTLMEVSCLSYVVRGAIPQGECWLA